MKAKRMTLNKKLTAIFCALALGAAVVTGVVMNTSSESPTQADPISAGVKTVYDNLNKPCAAAAAKVSALLLSDPRLKCDGAKIASPSIP
ncbi:MAG: hypothetical protein ACXW30_06720 [Micavibrio sp.]